MHAVTIHGGEIRKLVAQRVMAGCDACMRLVKLRSTGELLGNLFQCPPHLVVASPL